MSHIPATAMPHARAHDDGDDAQAQAEGTRPEPEATTATPDQSEPILGDGTAPAPLASSATDRAQDMAAAGPSSEDEPPLASAGPGTATGNREGSDADATAEATGGAATGGQSAVDGTVTAAGDGERKGEPNRDGGGEGGGRSTVLIAAAVLGGLTALGGAVAAVLPRLRDRDEAKRKKGKKRKA